MHKRTNPKVFKHAKQLRRNQTEAEAKLIIELDGGQRLEQEEYDAERTKSLESKGCRVLRFWNNEVMKEKDSVMGAIELALDEEELLWLLYPSRSQIAPLCRYRKRNL